jgi:alpha-N-arabinofuranosidase
MLSGGDDTVRRLCAGCTVRGATDDRARQPYAWCQPQALRIDDGGDHHSYEGGLYAELVANRTFRKDWQGIPQWELVEHGDARAAMSLDKDTGPSKALASSLRLEVSSARRGSGASVTNSGYWGMAMRPETTYRGSFYAKSDVAKSDVADLVMARVVNDRTGAVQAQAAVEVQGGEWKPYTFQLRTGSIEPSVDNHLELTLERKGTLWLQLVSVMPPAFHGRANGTRSDLMERMAAMHPNFLRMPGGNYVEGDRIEDWYNWKQTVGPLVDRPGHQGPWSYWSTDGFGLLEFLEWCEDLHMEPVLAVYAGYSLHGDHVTTGAALEPYVQSALDEAEYVNGDVSTRWGAQRAKDGHPAPFPLHYIEIGNEDMFDKSGSYDERFAQFANVLRAKSPQYQLIATTSVKEAEGAVPNLIDDHYYKTPADMMDLVGHYDDAPRTGPKIFVGEWATRSGTPTPNFGDALGDAAWMTSIERNSDLIVMASYAPLLVNVNPGAMQWSTDLIGFDGMSSYGSPSYYAQVLFAGHLGDGVAKSVFTGSAKRFFYSVTVDTRKHVLHIKLVNATDTDQPLAITLTGVEGEHTAEVFSLHGATYEDTNSMERPDRIQPVHLWETVRGDRWEHTVPALTIQVMDVSL